MAVVRYARPLASFIRESVAPTLDSDEVATAVNDAFIGLAKYAARRKFHANGALSTLLFSIARLKAYDQLRRKPKNCGAPEDDGTGDSEDEHDGSNDDDFAVEVSRSLVAAPEIAILWKTAADEASANEIIRLFRLWIGTLPRLQRKVAQALLRSCGHATNGQICDELAKDGPRPSEASVKSARRQIVEKFKTLITTQERAKKS